MFSDKDVSLVTNYLMTKSEDLLEMKPILLSEKVIMSDELQKKVFEYLKDDMELKASVDLKNPNVLIAIRTGAGSNVTSSQSTASKPSSKAKGTKDKSKKQALSDEPIVDLSFLNEHQLQKKISEKIKDITDDVVEAMVDHMFRWLNFSSKLLFNHNFFFFLFKFNKSKIY